MNANPIARSSAGNPVRLSTRGLRLGSPVVTIMEHRQPWEFLAEKRSVSAHPLGVSPRLRRSARYRLASRFLQSVASTHGATERVATRLWWCLDEGAQ